ncbi:MAG: hypothetical protein WBC33_02160 [Conexibacter sp.]
MRHIRPRFLLVAAVIAIALLVAAASATAFSVTSVTVAPRAPVSGEPGFGVPGLLPANPAASGAHPVLDITATFDVSASGGGVTTAQTIVQHLGPGIVANPHATSQCSRADFNEASPLAVGCAATTQVGTAAVTVLTPAPVTLPGKVYNLEPDPGEPAALGVALDLTLVGSSGAFLKNIATVAVDPQDLGLLTTLDDLNPSPPIAAIKLTLWGYAATGGSPPLLPFFTNPTACTLSTVSVTATAHNAETSTNSGSYTPTDCDTAPFDTSLTVAANPSRTDSLSAISVDVKPAPVFVPRVNSYVKQNTVILPPGTLLNPALAASLDACTDAQFARDDPSVAPTCPASSEIGAVAFVSPILGPFPGTAYFGTGTATDTLRLFLDVPLFGAHIKVIGGVRPDKTTGQVTTVFDNLPQVAFTNFTVDFNGPPLSVFTTPTTCGTNTASAINQPYSGGPASTPTATFETSYDGAGAPCVTTFRPWFTGTSSSAKAGAKTSYTLKFGRPDRDQRIDTATFRLPAGLVGDLTLDGLVQCSLGDAAKAACGDASKVGTAQVEVGSGPAPASLSGSVYLTEPKVAGDPAALSVLVPAKLGPVDLGNVIVGARLQLRSNGGLTATSDTLPQFQEGITTSVRLASIAITRNGFMRNPTSCGRKRYSAAFDALGGGSATAFAALTISDCKRLRFAPKLAVALGGKGKTTRGTHPVLTTTITQGDGQAAIRRAHVRLPDALSTNLTSVNAACEQDDFAAGTCAKSAKVATATATSPLIAGKITGPVYLVRREKGKLPKLVVQLRDPIALSFEGNVNVGKGGRVGTTFPAVPDLAVTKFVLKFHSGKFGALTAVENLCARRLRFPADFKGQNGKVTKQRPVIAVKGCRRR